MAEPASSDARRSGSRPAPAAERPGATPMAFVRAVVAGYARHGVDPCRALAAAGIAPERVAEPQGRITAGQMESLCGSAMRELDDEALGWFSRRLPWGSYGLLCRASLSAPTLGVAVKRWCRHHRLLTEDLLLRLEVSGDVARVTLEERRELGALREFCLLSSLRYLLGYACWLIDSRIGLRESAWPDAEPPHAAVYARLFDGALRFGAPQAALSFDARYLALPPCRDETALRAMLQRALPLTVRPYRRDRLLRDTLRGLLRTRGAELRRAAAVAEALGVSTRSLHRQLRAEGSALQALRDEVHLERALQLLERSERPLKQVAAAVGYADAKSFSRAFKAWTGRSPGEVRRRAASAQAALHDGGRAHDQ
jgi:AraC-like DNA-binding protein